MVIKLDKEHNKTTVPYIATATESMIESTTDKIEKLYDDIINYQELSNDKILDALDNVEKNMELYASDSLDDYIKIHNKIKVSNILSIISIIIGSFGLGILCFLLENFI